LIKQKNELKKLREEFEEFTFGVNTGTNEIKTILIKPNENKEDWKSLSTKMQKLKMDVQSGIR
jgi:peptidoglycan hydrolase CwlO-like protein